MTFAFFCLAAVCLFMLVYPFVIYPVLLCVLPRQHYGPLPDKIPQNRKIALLFCAHNEEKSLPAKLSNIRQLKERTNDIEVRVFTDCCTDRTIELLREAADILTLHEGQTRVGKAAGMRELVAATDADILVFTDANVILAPDAIDQLVKYFDDPGIGTVTGRLHYTNSDESPAAQTGSIYWRLEEWIKVRESLTGSTMGADGSIFATRRVLYPDVPTNLLDDLIVSISPIFDGYRVVSAPDVHAFEKGTTDTKDEIHRKRRIGCRAFNTHRYLAPKLRTMSRVNRFKYFSHKYLRWLSAIFLIGGLVFLMVGAASVIGPAVTITTSFVGVLVILIGRALNIPVIGGIADAIISILAVGLGVADAIGGRNYQVWSPAKSRH